LQGIPRAGSLRNDLTEDDDQGRGDKKTNCPTGDVSHQDGEGGVHHDVAKEKGTEQHVSLFADRLNSLGAFRKISIVALGNDLKTNDVESEKAQREA